MVRGLGSKTVRGQNLVRKFQVMIFAAPAVIAAARTRRSSGSGS
jgi:hypothetical protein